MRRLIQHIAVALAIGIIGAVASSAPRCTGTSSDGLRMGGMLLAGCDKRGR